MKLFDFLTTQLPKPKKLGIVIGSVIMFLFSAASVCLSYSFELPLAAVLAYLAGFGFVFYKSKLYMLYFRLPPIFHIIALLVTSYVSFMSYKSYDSSTAWKILTAVSWGVFILTLAGIILALVLSPLCGKKTVHKGFVKALAAFFPLYFTVFAYLPSELFLNNRKDFFISYLDIAPYFLVKTIVFTLLSSLAVCALKEKVYRVVCALSVGLTLGCYCQYVFMNGVLPQTLGEPVDWDSMAARKIINAVIWVVVIALPTVYVAVCSKVKAMGKNTAIKNGHLILNAFVGGVQVLSLAILMISSGNSLTSHEKYILDNSQQFTVSSKKNVITFILDASDRHYFDKAYEQSPEKFDFLKDFTYYTNACMMYDSTYLSIPQMLSGTTELPQTTINSWFSETWSSESCEAFYSRLHDENYQVNFYGDFCYGYEYAPLAGKVDNCVKMKDDDMKIDKQALYDNFNSLSAYRYMPLLFKSDYEITTKDLNSSVEIHNSCIMDNNEYLSNLELKSSESDKNYFIVEHLNGTHLQAGKVSDSVSVCLEILKSYIFQLKKMGVYDDSVIIVTGDHGTHGQADNMPIWYIKTAGAKHDKMQYSSAPIHHMDYVATCVDAAGIKKDGDEKLFGRSIFQIGENEKRQRLVFQRSEFEYVGPVDWKKYSDNSHRCAAFGYYFTGDREDLVNHEKNDPPDILLELDDYY